jgi:hypothetical protein
MVVVLSPSVAAKELILLLGPANVLSPITDVIRQRIRQAIQLAEGRMSAWSVEAGRGERTGPHLLHRCAAFSSVEVYGRCVDTETIC